MKDFLKKLGFSPKDNMKDVFIKIYKNSNNYIIEVDFEKWSINYWDKIKAWRETTQNFSQEENRVVLECVDRLLEKWYKADDIILEQKFTVGHGASWGWLDVLVKKKWKAFLMIECKTWGCEYEKELKNIYKNGGQLFTYFRQDTSTEYLVLYASNLKSKGEIEYKNEIIKIEESYRETSNVEDFFIRWNKFTKQNWIFEDWIRAYDFESRALTLNDLEDIKESDASFIFNRFLEILRHNTVSDKPNAFNKIFTLFLCKIYDEWHKRKDEELEFQWIEWVDDHVKFQTRLTDLYKRWMMEFLKKEITDFNDEEFNKEFGGIDESIRNKILEKITKLRLQKNNEFAIKEVFDQETFEDNAVVLKEVVELLQNYKVRYAKKQPFLWDFFELLLTTWLKQESGQFFTPVPIARFICKSIPIAKIVEQKALVWDTTDLLPSTIDYAAWSWHFLTESMEEIQNIINNIDTNKLAPNVEREIKKRKETTFDWAGEYMYGIEKDYRLVKTAKVGCYLHWDGIATIIHGDGLDNFEKSKHYRWKLKEFNSEDKQENAKFDLVLSNPPYSVSAFKWNLNSENAKNDFDLYDKLTDSSSEIEALFIERTSQLLKEWWIAAVVLPSSILSNTGIYTKAREIILKDFDVVAITELWSGTFMATGTNTVILFLRKRNKFFARNLEAGVSKFILNLQDVTLNGVENIFSKYVDNVWAWVKFEDYITLLQKAPNENIKNHEIYKAYKNKVKLTKRSEEDRNKEFFDKIIDIEKEKLLYFVITCSQQVVLVKSGEKKIEKEFLGYEFSTRKWSEGIHSMQRWKLIDECTKLFDPETSDNPEKASTYIYDSFENKSDREISKELGNHIFRAQLSDLITFDRSDFEKNISLNSKKKVRIESKWEIVKISDICEIWRWRVINKKEIWDNTWKYPVYSSQTSNKWIFWHLHNYDFEGEYVTWTTDWVYAWTCFYRQWRFNCTNVCWTLKAKDDKINMMFLWDALNLYTQDYVIKVANPKLMNNVMADIKIPLPPKDIQQQIVDEIWEFEEIKEKNLVKLRELYEEIKGLFEKSVDQNSKSYRLSDNNIFELGIGSRLLKNEILSKWRVPVYSANVFEPFGYVNENLLNDFWRRSVVWWIDGDWMVNYINENLEFYPTDHCGYLRVKDWKLNERFVEYFLRKEWDNYWFSRTKRASIDRIQNIKISLPDLETQKQIVSEVENLEKEINKLKEENAQIPSKKKEVLKKYL